MIGAQDELKCCGYLPSERAEMWQLAIKRVTHSELAEQREEHGNIVEATRQRLGKRTRTKTETLKVMCRLRNVNSVKALSFTRAWRGYPPAPRAPERDPGFGGWGQRGMTIALELI